VILFNSVILSHHEAVVNQHRPHPPRVSSAHNETKGVTASTCNDAPSACIV